MCYSAEVSIGTFGFVSLICLFLWQRGRPIDKALTWILLIIASMQLIEFGLWKNLECGWQNKVLSAAIPVLLWLQPLVIFLSIWYYKVGWLGFYGWLAVVYIIALPFIPREYFIKHTLGQCTTVGDCGHLNWPATREEADPYNLQLFYNIAIITGLSTLKSTTFSAFYIISAYLSYIYTKMYYRDSWSSVWCHFVNALAVGAVVLT